jgi:hypothetical protein
LAALLRALGGSELSMVWRKALDRKVRRGQSAKITESAKIKKEDHKESED